MGVDGGLGLAAGGGFGLPAVPPGEVVGVPGLGSPIGILLGACPGACQKRAVKNKAVV